MSEILERDATDIPDDEMERALNDADEGRVTIEPIGEGDWQQHYCGIIAFRLGNGYEVAVFNDCDEWDYIEFVIAPDGRREDFGKYVNGRESFTRSRVLRDWQPRHPERWGTNCPAGTR